MSTAPAVCLKCRVPLVPGTGFCGTCGTPAGQTGTAAQFPPAQPLPAGFSGGLGAPVVLPPMNPTLAPGYVAGALTGAGATVTGMSAAAVAFTTTRSSKRTLGLKVRFRGIAEIAPGMGGTTATIRVKLEPSSIVPVVLIIMVLAFAGFFFSMGQSGTGGDAADSMGQLAAPLLIGLFVPYFLISRGSGRAVLDLLTRAVSTGTPPAPGFPPPPTGYAAPAAPAYGQAATPPPPAAPVAPVAGLFDQLRELGALRDQGVLSAAEHDQARAALLAKLA